MLQMRLSLKHRLLWSMYNLRDISPQMLPIHMMQFMLLNNWEPADESIRQRTTESETSEYIKHQ